MRPTGFVGWPVLLIAGVVLFFSVVPLLALLWKATGNSGGVWPHLLANVLPNSIITTLLLLAGVGVGTLLIGSGTAWLVSRFHFPLRNVLVWALVLPLSVPTYIAAYTWVEFADYTGPLQETVRALGGYENARQYWFPDIRSLGGAIALMSLVLFPYVYLAARLAYSLQGRHLYDVARLLGAGSWRLFFTVALPVARPALAVGVILALMETLNDIGAVEHLGVRTLTFSVFDTWLNRGSLSGAAQLSLLLLAFVIGLTWLERHLRRSRAYQSDGKDSERYEPVRLKGVTAALASIACLLPVLLGFGVPVFQMLDSTFTLPYQLEDPALYAAAANSVLIAFFTAICCVLAGFALVYVSRVSTSRWLTLANRLAAFGYAVPGTILAIGVLVALSGFDNWLSLQTESLFGFKTGLLLSGSMAIIVFACSVRFLAIAAGNIEAGYEKLSDNLFAASRTLGHTRNQTLLHIELPLVSKAMAVASVLVFVETMKELSATIMLRPFNFDTLATYAYSRASRALFEEASFAALLIVIIGLVPVYVLTRVIISEHGANAKKMADRSRSAS